MERKLVEKLTEILVCPDCLSRIIFTVDFFRCSKCHRKFAVCEGIPILTPSFSTDDISTTRKCWDKNYKDWIKGDISDYLNDYRQNYLNDTLNPIKDLLQGRKGIYCEIGCGPGITGLAMAKMGYRVVGIDLSLEGLKLARNLYSKEKIKGLLVCGDILSLPFKNDSLDLIYGGGVLEHFKDTSRAIDQLYRVLRKNGHVFLTVPFVSLSTLTYRQMYGNIPDVPVLGGFMEFFHIHLLKGKYLRFGYEKSFTQEKLKKMFLETGFKEIKVNYFKCHLPFNGIKSEGVKRLLRGVARWKFFWPMIYIIATK